MRKSQDQPGGIYIHVPFCVRKCSYCDFYSCTNLHCIPDYLDAVVSEIDKAPEAVFFADTIYLGGGTPSLLSPKEIELLIERVCRRFDIAPGAEITMEVNPGTVTARDLAAFRLAGVNRINIGVQSFQNESLSFLTRIHSAEDSARVIEAACSAGFDNIGLDLIYGLPRQTETMWEADLRAAVRMNPWHLSCYMLTYDPGTRMAKDLANGRFQPLPDERVARLFELTIRFLEDNGFSHYEVSNFAASFETRSRHNQKYWSHGPYFGFGPSAHSFHENQRFWNVDSLEVYLGKIRQGQMPTEAKEDLTRRQLMMETLYLRLRCNDGISISGFETRFDADFNRLFGAVITRCQADGLLQKNGDCLCLTKKGTLLADGIASQFIDALN